MSAGSACAATTAAAGIGSAMERGVVMRAMARV